MHKLILLWLVILSLTVSVNSQSTFWEEEFDNPGNWSLENNWNVFDGKLGFTWDPTIYNFDESSVSQLITLDQHATELTITQALSIFTPSENETAQIILVFEEEEVLLWEYSLINGDWGDDTGTDITFSLSEYLGQTMQIKFRTFGETSFNWSWWHIFEVNITAEYTYDLWASEINGPKNLDLLEPGEWIVEVVNQGSETINNYSVNLFDYKSGNVLESIEETDPIDPGESKTYVFSWAPYASYNTLIQGQVVAAEDQFTGNNLSYGKFLRIEPDFNYEILIWNNDNGIQDVICPEHGDLVTSSTGLERVLNDAGLSYDYHNNLPIDLSTYDIIISTMGCYCLG